MRKRKERTSLVLPTGQSSPASLETCPTGSHRTSGRNRDLPSNETDPEPRIDDLDRLEPKFFGTLRIGKWVIWTEQYGRIRVPALLWSDLHTLAVVATRPESFTIYTIQGIPLVSYLRYDRTVDLLFLLAGLADWRHQIVTMEVYFLIGELCRNVPDLDSVLRIPTPKTILSPYPTNYTGVCALRLTKGTD